MKKIAVFFVFATVLGVCFLNFNNQNRRLPASISSSDTNSGIIEIKQWPPLSDTKKQIKRKVLASWDWVFHSKKLSINFENIKIQTETETHNLCDLYSTMVLILEAPDYTYSGEHPEILITSACQSSQAGTSAAQQVNTDYDFDFLTDQDALKNLKAASNELKSSIRLQNWDSETPLRWKMKQLIFIPTSNDQAGQFDITKYEILGVLGYSVDFEIHGNKK